MSELAGSGSGQARLRPRFSIGAKLALWTLLVLMLVTVVVARQVIAAARENLVKAKSVAAAMVTDQVAQGLSAPMDFGDGEAAQQELDALKPNKALHVALAWTTGESEPVARVGAESAPAEPLRGSPAGDRVFSDRIEVVRVVYGASGQALGKVAVVFSLHDENAAFARSKRIIVWFSALVSSLTALLLIGLTRWTIVRPLDRLVQAARRIGRGEAGVRVQLERSDELGRLATVFNTMSEAIVERETRLAMAMGSLRELFDHMRQAIVVFGADGRLEGEASREAARLFAGRALPGAPVQEVLYSELSGGVEGQALVQWIELVFASPASAWHELAEFAPKEAWVERAPGDMRYVRLEFQPVFQGERIARVMLLASDESEVKRLETEVRSKDEEHARHLAAMRRLVAGGGQIFVTFMETSIERIERCQALLHSAEHVSPVELHEIFQHVHTIKGEARAFDLDRLAKESAQLEEELAAAQAERRCAEGIAIGPVRESWTRQFDAMRESLLRAEELFIAASPIGRAVLDQITVSRSEIDRLSELAGNRRDELGALVKRLAARPFGEATASLVDRVPSWADAHGKRARLEVVGKELRIPADLARVLPGVLTHLIRNAIAHGIETPEQRVDAGKHEVGIIRITCRADATGITVCVEDDGKGLDHVHLERRAQDLKVSGEDTRELVFVPGLSTSEQVTEFSGRGLGLSAVRSQLSAVGCTIRVAYSGPGGTGFEMTSHTERPPLGKQQVSVHVER